MCAVNLLISFSLESNKTPFDLIVRLANYRQTSIGFLEKISKVAQVF